MIIAYVACWIDGEGFWADLSSQPAVVLDARTRMPVDRPAAEMIAEGHAIQRRAVCWSCVDTIMRRDVTPQGQFDVSHPWYQAWRDHLAAEAAQRAQEADGGC